MHQRLRFPELQAIGSYKQGNSRYFQYADAIGMGFALHWAWPTRGVYSCLTGGPPRYIPALGAGSGSRGLALRANRCCCLRCHIAVAKIVAALRLQVFVEFVNQWNAIGNVQPDDVRV